MSTLLGIIIRDALESDLTTCLELDHTYDTDYVWQMAVNEAPGQWQITFKTEHLPRTLETECPANEHRLRLALPPDQCFLVVASKDSDDILAYLTMRSDPAYQLALIQDLVVARAYRRRRIGTRLVNVARQWAKEHHLSRLTAEVQTRNYPAISFYKQTGFTFCGFNDQYLPNQDIAVFFSQSFR
ncbi:MAG TPA: GNAT family N-acetyltransferase [Phototrophicaceae bacterium]|nr:GNAT family N-acetyltransferase [Phototrophicaceae bacterium]